MTELRRRMEEDMLARGFADRTRDLPVGRGRPRSVLPPVTHRISDAEVQAYLVHLLRDRAAIVEHVQHRGQWSAVLLSHDAEAGAHRLHHPVASPVRRPPVVLSRGEVERLIQTHLLEAGVDLHTIQRLLGHGQLTTTTRYFQLTRHLDIAAGSPLDLLARFTTPPAGSV